MMLSKNIMGGYYQPVLSVVMPINVMLDVETMGTGANAPIVSIGAVVFDPLTGELKDSFERIISLNSSAYYGKIDASTVCWWMEQSEEAREIFFKDTPKTNLKGALNDLNNWLESLGKKKNIHVWGNGTNFDNVIVKSAYDAVRLRPGFSPFNDSCCRIVVRMGKELLGIEPKRTIRREGVHHSALDDAKFQAQYISEIWRRFYGMRKLVDIQHYCIKELWFMQDERKKVRG